MTFWGCLELKSRGTVGGWPDCSADGGIVDMTEVEVASGAAASGVRVGLAVVRACSASMKRASLMNSRLGLLEASCELVVVVVVVVVRAKLEQLLRVDRGTAVEWPSTRYLIRYSVVARSISMFCLMLGEALSGRRCGPT